MALDIFLRGNGSSGFDISLSPATPVAGGLSIAGFAPTVTVSGGSTNTTITPLVGAINFTGQPAQAVRDIKIIPVTGALSLLSAGGGGSGTFGDSVSGGDTFPGGGGNRGLLSKFTAPASGTVTQINALFDSTTSAGASFKGLIYAADGAGGIPGTFLGVGGATSIPAGGGDIASTGLSVSITSGTDYWIGGVVSTFNAVWNIDLSGGLSRMENVPYSSPAATWTEDGTAGGEVNAYATYTGSGGTGQAPIVTQGFVAVPATGSLSLSGVAPTVAEGGSGDTSITPVVGALSLTGYAPTVNNSGEVSHSRTPDTGALSLAGVAPTVVRDTKITPSTGALGISAGSGLTLIQTSGLLGVSATTQPQTFNAASNFQVGNTVVVSAGFYTGGSAPPITIAGTAATIIAEYPGDSGNDGVGIYAAKIVNAGRSDVVFGGSGSSFYVSLSIEEWAGLADSPADAGVSVGLSGPSTSPTAGSTGTLSQANELIYTAFSLFSSVQGSITDPSGYTSAWKRLNGISTLGGAGAYKIVSSTAAESPTFSMNVSDSWYAATGSLKIAASGGIAPTLRVDAPYFPVAGSLAIAGQQPTVTNSGDTGISITPQTGSLSVVGLAPTVAHQDNRTAQPQTGAINFTGHQPLLAPALRPVAAALAFTGFAPSLRQDLYLQPSVAGGTPTLGNHGSDFDLDGSGTSPSTVTFNSQATGSALVVVAFGDLTDIALQTDNKGNVIPLVETSGYNGGLWAPFGMNVYAKSNVLGGTSHTQSLTKASTTTESTLLATEVKNGGAVIDSSIVTRAGAGAGVAYTSASVTTTGPAYLVAIWGGDGGVGTADQTATPEAGFTTIESLFLGFTAYIQAAMAVKFVPAAGTYTCDWTPVANQGAILALVAIQANPGMAFDGASPTVKQNLIKLPVAGALALAGQAPTVTRTDNKFATPVTGSLTLAGQTPGVQSGNGFSVVPATGVLSLAGVAPAVTQTQTAQPQAGALGFTGYAPTVKQDLRVAPSTGSLSLAGEQPRQGTSVTPNTGVLSLAGVAPSVRQSLLAYPVTGSLNLTGYAPSVRQTFSAVPVAGALQLVGLAPTVVRNEIELPVAGALSLGGQAPTVRVSHLITPQAGAISCTGQAPVVIRGALVTPVTGALTLTGVAGATKQDTFRAPIAAAITLTGYAPSLLKTERASTQVGALSLQGAAPQVVTSVQGAATPLAAALSVTGYSPQISLSDIKIISVPSWALGLTQYAPTVVRNTYLTPTTGGLAFQGVAPQLRVQQYLAPSSTALGLVGASPVVMVNHRVTPVVTSLGLAGYAPVVSIGLRVQPVAGVLQVLGIASVAYATYRWEVTPVTGLLALESVASKVDQPVRDGTETVYATILPVEVYLQKSELLVAVTTPQVSVYCLTTENLFYLS